MIGKEQSKVLNITVSSGTGTGTVTNQWDICRWLRIKPIAETDTFNLTVKDAGGMIMLVRTSVLGTFSERIEMSLGIIRTVLIESATQDGTYVCKFDMH